MKTTVAHPPARQRGSVLVVGLIIATILGLTLASYLTLTGNQHRSVVRSQTWSASLALSEAGVEEALAFMNKQVGTGLEISTWTNSAGADGWTTAGNVYSVTREVDAAVGSYTVYITNQSSGPVISSSGNATWKLAASAGGPFLAAAGVSLGAAGSTPITRRVVVQTQRSSLFTVAMVSLGQIDLRGNNIGTDSFDSADTNYSTGGLYPLGNLAKTKANGSVITTSTLIDSLSVGNAKIKGMVKTGPNGSISIGPNGSVGDRAWVESGTSGIQSGYSANDVNLQFPSASLPAVSYLPAPAAIAGVTTFPSGPGSYWISTLSGKIIIPTNAQVILKVTGSVSMSGADEVMIAPVNASLAIYMEGATFRISGNAAVNNLSQNAANFTLYGLPTCTSIQMTGNAALTGSIYAPQADLTMGGGGGTTYDFVGACVSKTVTMNGHYNFHYDENLARVGPARGYVPTLWAER